MHDYSGQPKQNHENHDVPCSLTTISTNNIELNSYLGNIYRTDITEEFIANIEDGTLGNNVTERLDTSLRTSESQTVATEKSKKDVQCDLCRKYNTSVGFKKHRNDCVTKPENHKANRKN